jgi:uncharacterized protein YndB with AHSA1/START domain
MPQPFEITQEAEVEATPEQVWEAIATGPGQDSWFMGRNEVEPREGGKGSFSIGGFTEETTIETWDPPKRFVASSVESSPVAQVNRFDYTVEARGPGRSSIRYVHSGQLGGDDWQAMYEAMSEGDPMYFAKLIEYLEHFSGRFATPVDARGPFVGEPEQIMAGFRRGLGLAEGVREGDHVTLHPDGLPSIEGEIDCAGRSFLGVRTDDAIYRFICGFDGTVMVGHHLFSEGVDQDKTERLWSDWLDRVFSSTG